MKNKVLIYGRFLIALMVVVLCGLAFFKRFYPVKIFDLQVVSALQSGLVSGFGLGLWLLLGVIFLTLIFGRVYCSVLCPLGIYQEFLTILFKPFYKKRKNQAERHYVFAYFLAAILFGVLFGGSVVLLRLIDPYAVLGNALSGMWFGLGFMAALTILVFFKKRFFCINICPVGAILGLISRFSLLKIRVDIDKCKMCGVCARACPCGSIDFKNHRVNNETCVKCFKCLAHCQHGALYYGLAKAKEVPFSAKRRQLILSGLTVATLGVAFRGGIELTKKMAAKVKKVILPAGAGKTEDFANRCLNCNLCVQNCPMKIIKKANDEVPFIHLDYGRAYCNFNCHKCSEVCPSGAIKRLTLEQKQSTKIAQAVIDENVCVKCGLCVMECPKKIIMKEGGEVPVIQFDKCIGCGKCATVCPMKAIKIEAIEKQITLS